MKHLFRVVKRVLGCDKVRFRGRGEERAAVCAASGLFDLMIARPPLPSKGIDVSKICGPALQEAEPQAVPPREPASGASGPQETDRRS